MILCFFEGTEMNQTESQPESPARGLTVIAASMHSFGNIEIWPFEDRVISTCRKV